MTPAFATTRRWTRHEVDLPVRVFARGISQAIPGRGTELSAGGMALYAGLELKTSQTLEVEFVAASHARVAGVIRNRQGFCFGLEFLTPLSLDGDGRLHAAWPGTSLPYEPGPLSRGAAELFQKIKAARGNAAAYALLARVLLLAGRRDEARKAADRALDYFQDHTKVLRRNRQQRREQLRRELENVRHIMVLLADACRGGIMDPQLVHLLSDFARPIAR
jgi:tetratricopeptide (TPR) repeat protein